MYTVDREYILILSRRVVLLQQLQLRYTILNCAAVNLVGARFTKFLCDTVKYCMRELIAWFEKVYEDSLINY